MIICIIGSGGREHAICKSISLSHKVSKIYCVLGNAGTQELAENIDLDINNFEKILEFLKNSKVDLVIVGPEKPLVNGIVDFLNQYKLKVFGPDNCVVIDASLLSTQKWTTHRLNLSNGSLGSRSFLY